MRFFCTRSRVLLLCIGLLLIATTTIAAESWQVVVQKAPVRQSPQVFGKIATTLDYGTRVEILKRQNGWLQVRFVSGSGWLHESAVARRAATLTAGSRKAEVAASQQELTLAGKGFNQQVEDAYRQKNRRLDYAAIDRMQALQVDEGQLLRFVREGGLGEGSHAY